MNDRDFWDFPIATPWETMQTTLEIWGQRIRGDAPSREEEEALLRWMVDADSELSLETLRAVQVMFHWFDEELSRSPKRTRLGTLDEIRKKRFIERFVRSLELRYEVDERELSPFELWVEEGNLAWLIDEEHTVSQRWKELSVIWLDDQWSEATVDYLEEAITCYLLGQDRAAISLCRSLVELRLKERLGHPRGSEHGLGELIREADGRILVGRDLRFARKINDRASKVIHPRYDPNPDLAKELLDLTVRLMESLS